MKELLASILRLFRAPEPPPAVETLPWLDVSKLPEKKVVAKKRVIKKKPAVKKPAAKKPAVKKPAVKKAKK